MNHVTCRHREKRPSDCSSVDGYLFAQTLFARCQALSSNATRLLWQNGEQILVAKEAGHFPSRIIRVCERSIRAEFQDRIGADSGKRRQFLNLSFGQFTLRDV